MQSSLNALTPREMQVLSAEERGDDFDARFSPHYKCYQYRLLLRDVEPALIETNFAALSETRPRGDG